MSEVSPSETWRSFAPDVLEREYTPSSCVASIVPYLEEYRRRSDAAVAAAPFGMRADLRYGDHPDEVLDLFPTDVEGAPLLVYIHGGYWQRLGKVDSRFAGASLARAGIACAVVEYTLAPHATLEQIVDQCVRAVQWLREHATEQGIDADRSVYAGSSAGGHLAAMAAIHGPRPAGLVLFSGVFDVVPTVHMSVNDPLQLDEPRARAFSPLHLPAPSGVAALVAWGDNETGEFKRQSRDYAAHLAAAGNDVQLLEVEGCNHFDVVHTLEDPEHPVRRWLADRYAR